MLQCCLFFLFFIYIYISMIYIYIHTLYDIYSVYIYICIHIICIYIYVCIHNIYIYTHYIYIYTLYIYIYTHYIYIYIIYIYIHYIFICWSNQVAKKHVWCKQETWCLPKKHWHTVFSMLFCGLQNERARTHNIKQQPHFIGGTGCCFEQDQNTSCSRIEPVYKPYPPVN